MTPVHADHCAPTFTRTQVHFDGMPLFIVLQSSMQECSSPLMAPPAVAPTLSPCVFTLRSPAPLRSLRTHCVRTITQTLPYSHTPMRHASIPQCTLGGTATSEDQSASGATTNGSPATLKGHRPQDPSPIVIGRVHRGFCAHYNSLAALGLPARVAELAAAHPNYVITATGHSLGAAAATVFMADLAYRFGLPRERLALYTLGAPRPGDAAFSKLVARGVGTAYRCARVHLSWCVCVFG